jgi:MoaA/NifB/PqqE/SkfB family radical SAM enzyme
MTVQGRCTVQKLNHGHLCDTVTSAKEIGLNSISFLAADATSSAFNRPSGWSADRRGKVLLTSPEVNALEAEIERLIGEHGKDLGSGFVVENAGKLRRIVGHFRAALGQALPVAPRCNAPWVSAVVDAGGDVRPCFFHGVVGNIHGRTLSEIVNGPDALRFRQTLDIESNPICQQCVCSLYIPREAA